MRIEELYAQYKSLLFGIAYRMLGSAADAEDIVQDVFVIYSQQERSEVEHTKAYLVRMTTNRSINYLKSARHKREQYVGPWLPEPVIGRTDEEAGAMLERQEYMSYAMLVLLQQLTPVERAVVILRDAVGMDYEEISSVLDKKEANCRKIYSRARQKLDGKTVEDAQSSPKSARLADVFIQAAQTGNFEPLLHFLLDDMTLVTDGGGKVRAAYRPIRGMQKVMSFFKGVQAKGAFHGTATAASLNGDTGLLLRQEGQVVMALCFGWDASGSGVEYIYMIRNPDKLAWLNGESAQRTATK